MRSALSGLVLLWIGAMTACLVPEDDLVESDDRPAGTSSSTSSSSGRPVQTSSGMPSSSGLPTTSSSSSSSSSSSGVVVQPPPPPPPPQPLPGACFIDGAVKPAGPAPTEQKGDCFHDSCDGVSKDGVRTWDPNDVTVDDNTCVTHTCTTAGGTVHQETANVENGKSCQNISGQAGVCFKGKCQVCKPANEASCGTEGANEPGNDTATTATAYGEYSTVCGFSTGTDTDWYTFYADDGSFMHDVYNFQVWTTAPTVELCIYVACGGGGSPGGCPGGKAGPNGSYGCCWTGAPNTLRPSWDMDCSGTSEDSGTTYVSIRTPGGDSCEPYLVSGGY